MVTTSFKNIYKGKTVLVTGDSGFKGSWLALWLLNLGANVIGYSLPPRTLKDNYVICGLNNKITHIDGDIRDIDSLLKVFSKHKPEIVFHLAAQSLVLDSYKDPLYTFQTNVLGTVNLLESVRNDTSVKVVVVITSDKCYENQESTHRYRETDPVGGKDPYSASKGACEIITSSYIRSFFSHDNTTSIASARAGNAIGGGDWSDNRIFPDCMRALSCSQPITIRNPNSVRPWQHVLDPLCGYLTIGSLLYIEGNKYSGSYNFGPFQENTVSVKKIVEEIIKFWGNGEYIIRQDNSNQKEANLLYLDINKAATNLKWSPVLDYREAIKFAIKEYKIDLSSTDKVFNQRIHHINKYTELRQTINDNMQAMQ